MEATNHAGEQKVVAAQRLELRRAGGQRRAVSVRPDQVSARRCILSVDSGESLKDVE